MVHLCENMKGKVSEKVILNLKWSSVSSGWSFIQEYEGTGFRKSGFKGTGFRKSGLKGTGFGKVVLKGQVLKKWSRRRGSFLLGWSFTREYERLGFRKRGLEEEQSVIRAVFYAGI